MPGYYDDKLSAERLVRCYEIAPPRVRRYLDAEVDFVVHKIHPSDLVLELGCGYGRVLPPVAHKARLVIGIDNSPSSIRLGRKKLGGIGNCHLLLMDALQLGFKDRAFDLVACIQNGISAFHVDQKELIQEAIRVTKPGGVVLFSSYTEKFWHDRLEWFQMQSEAGLVGEIDYEKTGNGVIVCKDGFTATTVSADEFALLTAELDADVQLTEIDESSLFCEIMPH